MHAEVQHTLQKVMSGNRADFIFSSLIIQTSSQSYWVQGFGVAVLLLGFWGWGFSFKVSVLGAGFRARIRVR